MKSEVKFKVRSLNFARPVGKFTSDFIRGKKMSCHIIMKGVHATEEEAKEMAIKLREDCPQAYKHTIIAANLHWAVIAAAQDGLKEGQLDRYYQVAEALGFGRELADEVYQLYVDEMMLIQKAKKIYQI